MAMLPMPACRGAERGLAPLASSTQISNVWTEFAKGYFSFYFSGPWSVGDFRSRLPASFQSSWATAGVPGPTGLGASAPGGSSLAVFQSSPHQEAAWALVRYLSEPAVQARFNTIVGDLPARQSAWDIAGVERDPMLAPFRGQLARAKAVRSYLRAHGVTVPIRIHGARVPKKHGGRWDARRATVKVIRDMTPALVGHISTAWGTPDPNHATFSITNIGTWTNSPDRFEYKWQYKFNSMPD